MKKIATFLMVFLITGAYTVIAQTQANQTTNPTVKNNGKMCGKDCKMGCCKSKRGEKESKTASKKPISNKSV